MNNEQRRGLLIQMKYDIKILSEQFLKDLFKSISKYLDSKTTIFSHYWPFFGLFGHFWQFFPFCCQYFPHFWLGNLVLVFLASFGPFGKLKVAMFGLCLYIWAFFGHFGLCVGALALLGWATTQFIYFPCILYTKEIL